MFKLRESFQEIIESLEKGISVGGEVVAQPITEEENNGRTHPVIKRFIIQDTDFSCSSCIVEVKKRYGASNPTEIDIKTSWSDFNYTIYSPSDYNSIMAKMAQGQTLCKYSGAFRGFCEQNLLPVLTPLIEGDEEVRTSLKGKIPLMEYCKLQKELHFFKTQHECWVNIYPYPRAIYNFIKERVGNLVLLNGREYGLYEDLAEKPVSYIRELIGFSGRIEKILVGGEELTEDSRISEGQKIEVFVEPKKRTSKIPSYKDSKNEAETEA